MLNFIRPAWQFLRELYRRPLSAIGTSIVLFFFFLALFGRQIAPYPVANDYNLDRPVRAAPTLELSRLSLGPYPFGTDKQGRDVFSRVILGAESIFRLAGLGTLIAVLLGTGLGLWMGYQGGWLDEIIGRLIDAVLAIPPLLLSLVLVGIIQNLMLEPGSWQESLADNAVLLVISILYIPIVARVVRSQTLEIKTRQFVEAAQLRGESPFYIVLREILPSALPALAVEAALRFSYAIFLVASLSFLGFGAEPGSADWGLMVNDNRGAGDYALTPWALEYPALAIVALVIGVNLMSEGIKRAVQGGGEAI
jgi:peptide/nickel transport system permease protein